MISNMGVVSQAVMELNEEEERRAINDAKTIIKAIAEQQRMVEAALVKIGELRERLKHVSVTEYTNKGL